MKRLTRLDETKKVSRLFCLAASLALLLPASFASASEKAVNKFACVENSSGIWTTRMRFRRSNAKKDIINYTERYFELSGFPPEVRCKEITERLNVAVSSAIEQNNIRELVLKSSYLNGYDVICVSNSATGRCKTNEALITLKPGKDAYLSVNKMIKALSSSESTDVYQEASCRQRSCKVISVKLYPYLTR
jgi:Circadian oscillating protein COP23